MSIVTSPEGVFTLTKTILKAVGAANDGRQFYLQSLLLATQKELGSEPRKRSGRAMKLDEASIQGQLAALRSVHDRFYEAVLRACSEGLPGGEARAKELNRRSNFARTALSALRAYIRAGKDVTALAAVRVTKASLAVPKAARQVRQLSPKRLAAAAERQSKQLVVTMIALAEADKQAAAAEFETLMGQLAMIAEEAGLKIEGPGAQEEPVAPRAQAPPPRPLPFHVRATETSVRRQMERPA